MIDVFLFVLNYIRIFVASLRSAGAVPDSATVREDDPSTFDVQPPAGPVETATPVDYTIPRPKSRKLPCRV